MKRGFAIGLILTACSGLYAQSIAMRATIPFDFRVGDLALPAGQYHVTYTTGMLKVQSDDGSRTAAAFQTISAIRPSAPAKGELVFRRYGNDYFLAHVWTPDSNTGLELRKGAVEREVAASAGPTKNVTVAVGRK